MRQDRRLVEFRDYESLRRAHDKQIIKIAMEDGK